MNAIKEDWILRYGEYLRAGKVEEMIPLKLDHFPSSFYKYRRLNETFLKCLEEGWLYMSEPSRLNDAFECSLLIDNNQVFADFLTNEAYTKLASTFTESEKAAIKEAANSYHAYEEIMKKRGITLTITSEMQKARVKKVWDKDFASRMESFRICSFSTTKESLLMWAHYSDDYKGVCVEYDFLDESDTRAWIHPVLYAMDRPSVKSYDEVQNITFPQIYASVCKSIDWKYEQEWRYIAFLESQIAGKENQLKVPVPKAVYLGPLFELNSQQHKERLLEITAKNNIPVHQMALDDSEYKVRLKEL